MLPRFPVSLLRSRSLLRGSARRGLVTAMAGARGGGGGGGGGEDGQLGEFYEYMERLRNYERSGVPRGAGTDSDDGFDLGRMRRLLRRLGDPHTHFPAVHIAGTKGKGSTAAFLSNIMREQGYNVGCYTSPHLLTIRERISVGQSGGPVSAELLRDLFGHAKEAIGQSIESEDGALTHFEVFTALSYLLFSQENVDIAIVEAGLGGARDATNVIQSTELAASVITTVGKEHLAALGGSLQSIAVAKSGIIKQERPVIIGGPFSPDIEQILRDRAFLTQSPVISACDPGIRSITRCIGWDCGKPYQSCDIVIEISNDIPLFIELQDLKLQLLGDHQRQNAVTACCTALCLRELGWNISDTSIQAGLEKTQLPGRSQFLTKEETSVLGLDGTSSVLVDGGPRPDVVLLTEASIAGGRSRSMPASSLKEIWMAAAQSQGISCYSDIGTITGVEAPIIASRPTTSRSLSGDKPMLIGCCTPFSSDLTRVASRLLQTQEDGDTGLICVTGSLHMVSSVLGQLRQV
uniref:Mur ligase central domain-containing protein n=2 Tax=Oryza nivara TaxID=4536 RepID=A0A0E0JCM5_ORYNI